MTRQELIQKGNIWQVYPDGQHDTILFEGSRSKCKLFISKNGPSAYKLGHIRLAKIIYEPLNINHYEKSN